MVYLADDRRDRRVAAGVTSPVVELEPDAISLDQGHADPRPDRARSAHGGGPHSVLSFGRVNYGRSAMRLEVIRKRAASAGCGDNTARRRNVLS